MKMTKIQIKHMVDRFLSWRLPEDFGPDAGISFDRGLLHEPVGTNLFTATQAEAMVRYMLADLPEADALIASPPEQKEG